MITIRTNSPTSLNSGLIMFKATKLLSIIILATMINGCSSLKELQNTLDNAIETVSNSVTSPSSTNANPGGRLCADDNGNFYTCQDIMSNHKINTPHPSLFNADLHFNLLAEYTEQMAADMQNDVGNMSIDQSIIVASFVDLNSSLQTTNSLGIQLAESFINELQEVGLPMADHKLMGVLDVNSNGDFAFSRNMEQFFNDVNIGYVLTGTMVQNTRGLVVNARIINYTTNEVIASSSKFLPSVLVNQL